MAIIAADGSFEWEIPVTAIHDAHVLPNGHVLLQQGWTKIQEVTRDKKVVWQFDDHAHFKTINQIQLLDISGDVTRGEIHR